ncbi:MAG TPA: cupredoxin domain-containing protein [Dehalococcoidia bacterium]|nr:cupredoxin domain-containing protein [Dehalococcoidia bacterium]
MLSIRVILALFSVLAIGVGLVACGDDDNGSNNPPAATSKPAGATTKPAAATTKPAAATTNPAGATTNPAAEVIKVTARDFSFDPGDFNAPLNKEATIELTNSGNAAHTLTVYEDDAHTKKLAGASVQVSAGNTGEFNVTFTKAGDYYFRCEFHPTQMTGEIKVS